MYKRLLVPVDGGRLTERAISAGIELASQLGATIVGFAMGPVLSGFRRPGNGDDVEDDEPMSSDTAHEALALFQNRAEAAAIPYEAVFQEGSRVDRAILEAAESQHCDMIVMVTHGRGAFGEFLFGSNTKAVLAGSRLPLLVLK